MKHQSLLNQLLKMPRDPKIDKRKALFASLNEVVNRHGGFLTSVPGAQEVAFDALPGSALPDKLREIGFIVQKTGDSQRILAGCVVEQFTRRADGSLELLTPGSTMPVAETRAHAGVVRVEQFDLRMP